MIVDYEGFGSLFFGVLFVNDEAESGLAVFCFALFLYGLYGLHVLKENLEHLFLSGHPLFSFRVVDLLELHQGESTDG